MQSRAGSAWLVPRSPDPRDAAISTYILHQPGVHAFWSYWLLAVIHLRESPGMHPPILQYPGAQYEFVSMALNPEKGAPDVDGGQLYTLHPPDAVVQFHGVDDAGAARVLELAVQACVEGRLAADSDYRSMWERTIPATATHVAAGQHLKS